LQIVALQNGKIDLLYECQLLTFVAYLVFKPNTCFFCASVFILPLLLWLHLFYGVNMLIIAVANGLAAGIRIVTAPESE
jgi:hypothetical protein